MTNQEKWKRFSAILDEAEAYGRAIGKLNFDMECCAPEEGMEQAGDDMALLGKHIHALTHSPEYAALVGELHADGEGLSFPQRKTVEHLWERYEKEKNLTEEFDHAWSVAANRAYGKWLAAKKASDFSLFRDSLAEVVDFTRRAIDLRDEKPATYYNACLDDTEKGGSEAQMDAFFGALKERIVPLMRRIQAEGKPIREDFLTRPCPIPEQERFSHYLLEAEGLRKSALVLMTTEHPFTTEFGPHDVRVTTHYFEDNFISNIFSTLHEGGHALFMQNEPEEFWREHTAGSMSNAMHECISRFYENIIGRSEAFATPLLQTLRGRFPGQFGRVTPHQLYLAENCAEPCLIRCDADELTYPLHILVRYEIEQLLFSGEAKAADVPRLWAEKYKGYLGIDVPDDARGALQDTHWSDGSLGYFPTYSLGSAIGAQLKDAMVAGGMDFEGVCASGDLTPVREWLRSNIWRWGRSKDTDELVRTACGEPFDAKHYTDYLTQKFSAIYEL